MQQTPESVQQTPESVQQTPEVCNKSLMSVVTVTGTVPGTANLAAAFRQPGWKVKVKSGKSKSKAKSKAVCKKCNNNH